MRIEIYYNPKTECIQLVQDGELKTHDEGISSCEFLSYFKEDMYNPYDMKVVPVKDILEGFEALKTDCIYHSGEQFYKEYVEMVKSKKIEGELIYFEEY